MDATLSRWRSPVQIRYGSLIQERRQLADHFGLEPEMLRVRLPPFLLCTQHGMCRFPCEGRMASSTLAGCTSTSNTTHELGLPTGSGPVTSNHGCRVRLLSGLLTDDNKRHGTQTAQRRSLNLRDCLWVRLPPVLLHGLCSSRLPVKQLSQNKRGGRREVQFLHDPLTTWPVRLMVQDARPSISRYGFDSRTGC